EHGTVLSEATLNASQSLSYLSPRISRENPAEREFDFLQDLISIHHRHSAAAFDERVGAKRHIVVIVADDHDCVFIQVRNRSYGPNFGTESLQKTHSDFPAAPVTINDGYFQEIVIWIGFDITSVGLHKIGRASCRERVSFE